MNKNNKQIEHYLSIIDEIEKVRTVNNVNWMDVLRIAFKHSPDETKKLLKKINEEDKKISVLFKKLEE
jgi:Na+/serine symporter